MKCGVIIVAAGEGKRLKAPLPKAFVPLDARPLYQHSLTAFESHPQIDEIVLVIPPGPVLVSDLQTSNLKVVEGGQTRQESVANGLEALSPDCEGILVHDAARPFVTLELIDRLLNALKKGKNAIPVISVSDTIKLVEEDRVVKTVDRKNLSRAQTPQACLAPDLRSASKKAKANRWEVTDEASLLEKAGFPVYVVCGDPMNRKITTKEDFEWAEAILERRR